MAKAKTQRAAGAEGSKADQTTSLTKWIVARCSRPFAAYLGFALLTVAMFGDVLFFNSSIVLGALGSDLSQQFLGWRQFGFAEICRGNLALWNPHIFGGAPYFGGFQAALLYPPNALFCALSLPAAVNWSIALHVFLMGTFTHAWMRVRGLATQSAFFAGVLMMFGGTYFLHIYAGHLSNLCTMVWAPLILRSVDQAFNLASAPSLSRRPLYGCLLVGAFALAMQVFAGHPQYVLVTGLAAGLYTALCLIVSPQRRRVAAILVMMVVAGLALSAVQWMTGLQANAETIRSLPVPFEFASMFAFPPENMLTLLAPGFFGNMIGQTEYWGRWYLWEMSLFMGVTGFVAAGYGLFGTDRRTSLPLAVVTVVLALLALGVHTPMFAWLYHHVPGFDRFRGMSKFSFAVALFLVALAAQGFDRMTQPGAVAPRFVRAVFALAVLLTGAGLLSRAVDWRATLQAVNATNESYFPATAIGDPDVLAHVGRAASTSLLLAALTTAVLAYLLRRLGRFPRTPHYLLVLAIAEMMVFAASTRETFDAKAASSAYMAEFVAGHPGDYRILNTVMPNSAMAAGAYDLWGSDPGVIRRYAEFMAMTQGFNPDAVTQNLTFLQPNPLYSMLRLRYAFLRNEKSIQVVDVPNPMDRLQLVSRFRVLSGRDALFAAMKAPGFDPHTDVLLESAPSPVPESGNGISGTVRMLAESTDWVEIEADTTQPTILLVTDAFSSAWRGVSLQGSVQRDYTIQAANYVLQAIPLAAGHHHLRIEYAPLAFEAGKWLSLLSWLIFVAAVVRHVSVGLWRTGLATRTRPASA